MIYLSDLVCVSVDSIQCPICWDPYDAQTPQYLLHCGHRFHQCCLDKFESHQSIYHQLNPNYRMIQKVLVDFLSASSLTASLKLQQNYLSMLAESQGALSGRHGMYFFMIIYLSSYYHTTPYRTHYRCPQCRTLYHKYSKWNYQYAYHLLHGLMEK